MSVPVSQLKQYAIWALNTGAYKELHQIYPALDTLGGVYSGVIGSGLVFSNPEMSLKEPDR